MNNNRFTAVAVAALCALCGTAAAQALPEPMVNAARKAIVSNPEVQARWHNFTAAQAEKRVASAGFRPSIDLTASTGYEWTDKPAPVGSDDYSRDSATLSLTQMLFDGFFTSSETARMGYAELTRYYELLEISENTALEAVRAYADVARYSELVEEAKKNYVEHKLTSQQIEERSTAGVSRRVDLDQASGRLALAESNLLTEISNLHDVSARYLRIMGEAPAGTLPPLPEGVKLDGMPASAVDAMQKGLPGNPTINAAYENVRAAKEQIESRKAGYWPRVDFRIRESWGRNIDGVRGRSTDQVAEVLLNYNLYRGGADQAREKQAVEYKFQARELQEKACRDVRQTLAIAYNDVVRLKEQLGYLDQHRLSTEKAREAYRQQFDIGQRTLLDLLDTQNEYFEASRAYINARYNEFVAEARTLASMGKLTPALGVNRPGQPTLQDLGQDRGDLPPEELCPFAAPELTPVDKDKAVADAPPRGRPPVPVVTPKPATPTKLSYSADAFFDFDKSTLKPEGEQKLGDLAKQLKAAQLEAVIAVGHTDSMGSDAYNLKLSMARANSVKAYLVSQGVSADLIRTEGKGESQPVASNATKEGRAKNRRVDISIQEKSR